MLHVNYIFPNEILSSITFFVAPSNIGRFMHKRIHAIKRLFFLFGFRHDFKGIIRNRIVFACSTLIIFIFVQFIFWFWFCGVVSFFNLDFFLAFDSKLAIMPLCTRPINLTQSFKLCPYDISFYSAFFFRLDVHTFLLNLIYNVAIFPT